MSQGTQRRSCRVGLVLAVVGPLQGSGGAERLFGRLQDYLRARHSETTLITSTTALERFQAAGSLSPPNGVISLALGREPGRNRLGSLVLGAKLAWTVVFGRFDVIHVCMPSTVYLPFLLALRAWPWRPRVTVNVVDCTLSHSLIESPAAGTYEHQILEAHRLYQRWAPIDGVYSWYQAYVDALPPIDGASQAPVVRAARYCFTDPNRFRPAPLKERLIVFAGRLSDQKRPLLFVDAVAALRATAPELAAGWRFEMYGKGVLEREVAARIAHHRLGDLVTLSHAIDMAPVFARSRLFVSTQQFENFTSLAMLEAMAAGNAVIAEDVGQTREFVRPGANGLVVSPATPGAFAEAMAEYLRQAERHEAMAAESRRITTEVHTIDHFAEDITAFWRQVCAQP